MARWQRGEAEIEQLVGRGDLEYVTGTAADGGPLLTRASRTAATAASLVVTDPHSSFVLAYDAARFACNALLTQQGIRGTTAGGHYAVERAVRAQFGEGFRPFADLRRRRNELEYPRLPADMAAEDEAGRAVAVAEHLIAAAEQLLDQLGFFAELNS